MDFNAEPFWDDFEASNGAKEQNYMKILFRPGYAVQARELTQIQSILQNQVKSFGDHIFENGSPVIGGHITIDSTVTYLKLQPTYNGEDVDLDFFDGRLILNYSNTATVSKRAKVMATVGNIPTQPTLMVKYLRASTFDNGEIIQTPTEYYATLFDADASGFGSMAHINSGIFYVDGYFVQVQEQSIVLDAYGVTPSYRIGLQIEDEIMDESGDANLLDPAQESFNYQAPGAHRYKFNLVLSKRTLTSPDDSRFFELLRIENGNITKRVNYPLYSEIEKTLARRTYDESGDYIVNPFSLVISANTSNDNKANVEIGSGKAYVKGYPYESISTQKLNLNKARTTQTTTDYSLPLEYGNYLFANNFISGSSGIFNIKQLPTLDLHCVPSANINLTSSTSYNRTYMGTARVVNFDHDTSTNYILNLTDINLVSNTVTLDQDSADTSHIQLPAGYSTLQNAYSNVVVKVLSGPGDNPGSIREIISYSATNRIATLNVNLPATMKTGNTISLVYSAKDIESIVQPTSGNTALKNSMDVAPASRTGDYDFTYITDTTKNTLLFKLPESAISQTFGAVDFYHKIYGSGACSSGEYTVTLPEGSGEVFYYGDPDGSYLSTTSSNNEFIVMVTANSSGSPLKVGQVITSTGTSTAPYIKRINERQMTINVGATAYSTSISYVASVKANINSSTLKTKTFYPATSITTLRSTDSRNNYDVDVSSAGVKIDTANGFVWFNDATKINKTPNGSDNLYIPDVYAITKIYDSGSVDVYPSTSNMIDITERYLLNSGQKSAYYDHSKLILKAGYPAPKGRIVALVQYYKHDTTQYGYFSAASYPSAHYSAGKIPIFSNSDGTEYNLRDCIDFRPSKAIGTVTDAINGMINPIPDRDIELTYSYYVPRIDKVYLTQEEGIKILEGIPSKVPTAPKVPSDSMELYTLGIPAYTINVNQITITQTSNKRYTMKDIGTLEKRIENLEYYTALSLSEKVAKDKTILYTVDGTQKEKYGILVDNFLDFSKASVSSSDFMSSVEYGALSPMGLVNHLPLNVGSFDSTSVRVGPKTISLPYTEKTAISQNTASDSVSAAAFTYGMFNGRLQLIPASDQWFSDSVISQYVGQTADVPGGVAGQVLVSDAQAAAATAGATISLYNPYTVINTTTTSYVIHYGDGRRITRTTTTSVPTVYYD